MIYQALLLSYFFTLILTKLDTHIYPNRRIKSSTHILQPKLTYIQFHRLFMTMLMNAHGYLFGFSFF